MNIDCIGTTDEEIESDGHCDDPGWERDFFPHESIGVTGAVPVLGVVGNCCGRSTQPFGQSTKHPVAAGRVRCEELGLLDTQIRGREVRRQSELANLVAQRPPAQPLQLGWFQVQLATDEVGYGRDPVRMAVGAGMGPPQRQHHGHDLGRRLGGKLGRGSQQLGLAHHLHDGASLGRSAGEQQLHLVGHRQELQSIAPAHRQGRGKDAGPCNREPPPPAR